MNRIIMLLVLVGGGILMVPAGLFGSDTYSANFTSGLNTCYWQIIATHEGLYTIDDTHGDVRISKPVGGSYTFQAGGILCQALACGDFDVQVTYRDASIDRHDGSPGNQVQLNAVAGSHVFCVVRSAETGWNHNHHVWCSPPGAWFNPAADTSAGGTLRITRTGTMMAGYINDTLIYQTSWVTGPMELSCVLQNNGTRDAVSVTFDDFSVTADYLTPAGGDINRDGTVDLQDFGLLAAAWLENGCTIDNSWCEHTDVQSSGDVSLGDFAVLAAHWFCGDPY